MENRKSGLAFVALCGATAYSYIMLARKVNFYYCVIPFRTANAINIVLCAMHAEHVCKLNACNMHSPDGVAISL